MTRLGPMIRLGLRLAVGGGRGAAVRLVLIATAVAAGSALLLITLAGLNAVNAQNARYGWLATGTGTVMGMGMGSGLAAHGAQANTHDRLWWRLTPDFYRGQLIGRVDVAATGPRSPVPPGLPALPGPGQYYASPALAALLRSAPPGQLRDRYPGHQIGLIGPAALPSPDSLVIVTGYRPGQLAAQPGTTAVTAIQTTSPSSC